MYLDSNFRHLRGIPFVSVSKTISNVSGPQGKFLPSYYYNDFRDKMKVVKSVKDIADNIHDYTFGDYLEFNNVDLKRRRLKSTDPHKIGDDLFTAQEKLILLQRYTESLTYRIFNAYKYEYNVSKLSQGPTPIAPVPTVPLSKIIKPWVVKKPKEG